MLLARSSNRQHEPIKLISMNFSKFKRSHPHRHNSLSLLAQVTLTILLLCLLLLPRFPVTATTTGYLPEQEKLFQQVLAAAKLTPEDVKLDSTDMALGGGDKYRLNVLNLFFDNPWKISSYTRTLSAQLLDIANKSDLAQITFFAHRRTDAGVAPQPANGLLDKYKQQVQKLGTDALAVALSQLSDKPVDSFKDSQYKALPLKLRSAIAEFLLTVPDALRYRQLGLLEPLNKLNLNPENTYNKIIDYVVDDVENQQKQEDDDPIERVLLIESLLDNVDFKLLNAGAILTVSAAQELQRQLSELTTGDYSYNVETPQGRIAISGKGDQVYPTDEYLLIVDLDGNDTYSGGAANRNIAHGISVSLDLAGSDRYFNSGTDPSFGAGIFGYSVLMDMQGDDHYEAKYLTQGSGIFGTGILYDAAGQDTYRGIGNVQGSGSFGTGVLVDKQGSDRYYLYSYGQGYGFTKGVGLLLDSAGDDQYIGLEDKYPNGGPFGADKHIHFAQGAGFGRRADSSDGHSWAGGVGILVDGAGKDRYECDVYGQGTGYWYSVGFLVDKAGDDYHRTGVYSLGGAPHFAVGVYQDDSGSDRYQVRISQSLGKGRDLSIGWFEDSAGNDWYQGSHGILGNADINGIGVFWDKQGNDTYLSSPKPEPAYGQSSLENASGWRELMLTLGLFIDGGGKDNYLLLPENYKPDDNIQLQAQDTKNFQINPSITNDKVWCRPTIPRDVKRAYGCGIDAGTQ